MLSALIILLCLILNAFLAATEAAFVAVSKPHLKELARKGHLEAKKALLMRDNPERTLSILQVGITIVGVTAAAISGAGAEELLKPFFMNRLHLSEDLSKFISIAAVVIPYTYINVVFSELLPKTLALRDPKKILFRNRPWLSLLDKILAPIVTFLESSTKLGLDIFFPRFQAASEGFYESLDLTQLAQDHRQYLINLFNLEESTVRDVMIPWNTVVTTEITDNIAVVEMALIKSGHTRVPVLNQDEVVGMLHSKEFTAMRHLHGENWQELIRPHLTVKESDSLIRTLKLMQEKRCHLAIVYSIQKKEGIVTIEDILEEVIGEIYDEDDDGRATKIIKNLPKPTNKDEKEADKW